MLDEEHRHVRRDALDDVADALALGGGEPGERLVEQQQPRLRREREAHVEEALPAIGERAGLGLLDAGDAEIADERRGLALDRRRALAPAPRDRSAARWRAWIASRTFSSTESAGNRLVIWKERPMPGAR